MDGLTINKITTDIEFHDLSILAKEIWREHFSTILPPGQVEYMIEKFQSETAMKTAVEQDEYLYYRMDFSCTPVGYFAIKEEKDQLFLSKLYVEKSNRGKGFSSAALDFIKQYCKQNKLAYIWLTVNRNNFSSIAVYKHFGFKVFKECTTDIGQGYAKDDYYMELKV